MDTVNIVNEKNYQRCFELYDMNLYMFQNKTYQVFDGYMYNIIIAQYETMAFSQLNVLINLLITKDL